MLKSLTNIIDEECREVFRKAKNGLDTPTLNANMGNLSIESKENSR